MFSEYASRFLSQSQSRLSLGQPDMSFTRNGTDRYQPSSRPRTTPAHRQRRAMQNPYGSQAISRFAFASRTSNAPAPLFYSATDDFREEDDHEEHDREMADHYALQRSRRQFGGGNLTESSEADDDVERRSDRTVDGSSVDGERPGYGLGRGIRSSWEGEKAEPRGRSTVNAQRDQSERDQSIPFSETSTTSGKGKDKLVNVELASTIRGSVEGFERDDVLANTDDRPPSFQQLRSKPKGKRLRSPLRSQLPIPEETDEDTLLQQPHPMGMGMDRETASQAEAMVTPTTSLKNNLFWAELFIIAQCAIIGVFVISIFQETAPDKKHPLGDTIYTVLHASFRLIGVYSLVSILVGLLWLSLLRSFVRYLLVLIVVCVPVISTSFFLYPLISSYKGYWHGNSVQDKAMRWLSIGPLILTGFWVTTVWKGRHSVSRAADMLEFSGTILKAQPPLILVGIATLSSVVLWSWAWMGMFVHLFLGGHFSKSGSRFIIDLSTWWLGVAFFLDYFWVLAVISGVQRATTAAAVSQWYFHRNAIPTPAARLVVQESARHAVTTMAGTICLSTLLSLLVRLPLIVLPRRISNLISMCAYNIMPTPIAALTNPLTLTYASIHGIPLSPAAQGLSNLRLVSVNSPTTTLGPRSFSKAGSAPSLVSYRLAKLFLHAIRWVISIGLGFGGWVSTARMLQLGDGTVPYKGSLYAYVVGLISAAIGWGALGAMEGVVGNILDAVLVCWGSEAASNGRSGPSYCLDAGRLFGDEYRGGGYEV
ncbi:uncharacterized protein EI97DRAFT_407318 [Westerdykella ornata]|uniref:Protein PNS1 n=1 Tax=Westerdykella ornata TaxID=318751 RepID=A0A6A6J682_WESOR|nr:uncharacterized protein EI97DRAFT_407318 [Westerdykella ornata]KAF2271935.1 hypothetical protein EI97DRAFT_407318 [Westerdykella ornata]